MEDLDLRILPIDFTDDEKHLNKLVSEFNRLAQSINMETILEMSHYELAKISKIPSPSLWKEFLLNPKIKNWYQSERALFLNSQVQKLIKTAPESHSTGAVQALNSLLNQQKLLEEAQENKTIIIYNSIPLTTEERKNTLINVNKNIPSGIRRAITYINEPDNNKR